MQGAILTERAVEEGQDDVDVPQLRGGLAGLECVDSLPSGACPASFSLFAGSAFQLLKGRGLPLDGSVLPYFLGQLLLAPLLLFERRLNLAMQTVICRKPL